MLYTIFYIYAILQGLWGIYIVLRKRKSKGIGLKDVSGFKKFKNIVVPGIGIILFFTCALKLIFEGNQTIPSYLNRGYVLLFLALCGVNNILELLMYNFVEDVVKEKNGEVSDEEFAEVILKEKGGVAILGAACGMIFSISTVIILIVMAF